MSHLNAAGAVDASHAKSRMNHPGNNPRTGTLVITKP